MSKRLHPPAKLPLRIAPNGKAFGGYPILDAEGNYIGRLIGKHTTQMIIERTNREMDMSLSGELEETRKLLKEAVSFMNLVPNRKYGNHYELCARIDRHLKSLEK